MVWCRVWLAVDVWLCTASIYNLCAISIDRYLAISRPVQYPTLMSSRRARMLIIAVWILSFVICFPPLIGGWNDLEQSTISNCSRTRADYDVRYKVLDNGKAPYELNTNVLVNSPNDVIGGGCGESQPAISRPICSLTSDPGYIIYSACGSFWVPMLGMVGFYWKIYKTAVAATAAYKRGFVEQKTSGLSSSTSDNALCTLRIHRGGSSNSVLQRHSNGCLSELLPRPSADVIQATRRSVVDPQTHSRTTSCRRGAVIDTPPVRPDVTSRPIPKIIVTATASCTEDDAEKEQTTDEHQDSKNKKSSRDSRRKKKSSKQLNTSDADASPSGTSETEDGATKKEKRKSSFLGLFDSDAGGGGDRRLSLQIAARFAKLHIISQLRSLNKEKKAAKTVGIIVGCFIMCWAPFFTVYLTGAFCPDCTSQVVFHVFFWLGYCNSAVNPFIYGLCSRDFRYAFSSFLRCEFARTRSALTSQANTRMLGVLQTMTMQIVARAASVAATNNAARATVHTPALPCQPQSQ